MSNNLGALLSATFYERGYEHLVEVIHQRDAASRRRLDDVGQLFLSEDRSRDGNAGRNHGHQYSPPCARSVP